MVFSIRENGPGPSTCHKEITALHPSSHSMGINRVPFAAIVKKVGLHGEDSKIGDETGDVFDIGYRPKNSIKGQVLADFMAKFTLPP